MELQKTSKSHFPANKLNLVPIDDLPINDMLIDSSIRNALMKKIRYHIEGLAENSQLAFRSDMGVFLNWCREHNHQAIPVSPQVFRKFLLMEAHDKSPATILRRVATVNKIHKLADCKPLTEYPEVVSALKVIQEYSSYEKKQAESARYKQIQTISALIDKDRLLDVRDYAVLQFAYSTLLRRSEVAKVQVEHFEYDPETRDGLVKIDKIKSKKGVRDTHYAYLSEQACFWLMRWLKLSGIKEGYIFRSLTRYETLRPRSLDGRGISSAINRMGLYLGDDFHFTGHSTRIGAAQDMVSSGIETTKAMNAGRWRDHKTFIGYVAKLNVKENGMAEFFRKQH